ncbi:MAG: bifunctional folylpolyglutamate synthase/dihydrofolate synthase [Polyangiaceae bacterium]
MPALPQLLEALAARASRQMVLGLDATRAALARLGDPQRALEVVHIAGTNGKGSTSAMVECIARRAGLRTGLYTSPHLCRFAERIRLDGAPIDDDAFAAALERALTAGPALTFFETLTVAGFEAFARARVELAVLEVGLGGRLDATNVVDAPRCTAVTGIALDHVKILGGDLASIAREKAGIFKRGAPVVLGPLAPEARAAILEVAVAMGAAPVVDAPPAPAAMPIGLPGAHQRRNAGVAGAVARVLAARWPAMAGAIEPGLAAVRWPGRLDIEGTRVVLDCAHNAEAAEALAAALPQMGLQPAQTCLLYGALADKPWAEMLARIAPLAARRVYTEPAGRSPAPLAELARIADGETIADPSRALAHALAAARGGALLITGSSYLVGALRGVLVGERCDPVIAL